MLNSGKVKVDKKACQANELMIEAVQTMQTMAQEHGIKLVTKYANYSVWADYDYIVQTSTNLLSNAIKFAPPESTVWLSIKSKKIGKGFKNTSQHLPNQVTFQVKDQGQGIPANQLKSIDEDTHFSSQIAAVANNQGMGALIASSLKSAKTRIS